MLSVKTKHLISVSNLSFKGIQHILARAGEYDRKHQIEVPSHNINPSSLPYYTNGCPPIVINAFFEPSTRTQTSFESASLRLNTRVINFNYQTSSANKGETDEDTVKTLASYGDLLVIRHPENDFVEKIADKLPISVINAGNGNGEHPTQALLDLYTINKHYETELRNGELINILFVGDIKHSRTVHSLIEILHHFPNVKIELLPNKGREGDTSLLTSISINHDQEFSSIVIDKKQCDISKYDVIYMTRSQNEREKNHLGSVFGGSEFVINNKSMLNIKDTAIIMHPLPRNDEISPEVDDDPRCVYFEQMKNGVFVRMALIELFTVAKKNKFYLPIDTRYEDLFNTEAPPITVNSFREFEKVFNSHSY